MGEPTYEDIERIEQDDGNEDEKEYKEYFKKYRLDLSWAIYQSLLCLLLSCCCIMNLLKFKKGYSNLGTRYHQNETYN